MRALNRLEEEMVGGGVVWVECCGCGGSLLKVEYMLKLKGFGIFISVSLFVRVGLMLNSTTCNTIHASSSRVTFIMPRLRVILRTLNIIQRRVQREREKERWERTRIIHDGQPEYGAIISTI